MRSSHEVPVVIIGAGPTGGAAANLLGRLGIPCLVVERHRTIHPFPRAVHLDDEVFRILSSAGLGDQVRAITRPVLGMQLVDAAHRPIVRFHRDPVDAGHGCPGSNMFDQFALEEVLRTGLKRFPHVELRCGAEVVALGTGHVNGHARAGVTVRDRITGEVETIRARAVLGCDGANSATRATVGTELEDLGFSQQWFVLDIRSERSLVHWDGVHQVCDPGRAATFMRVGADRYRWEFHLRAGESPDEITRPEVVRRLTAPWLAGVDSDGLTVLRQGVYTARGLIARRWRRGPIFLLGDAAHQMPPFLGQGMCAGIRDAANLAWKLDFVLRGRADARLLDSYEAERRPHARRVARMSILLGRTMTSGAPAAVILRSALVRGARPRLLEELMIRSVWPPLEPGSAVRPVARRPQRTGQLCPQPAVMVCGGSEVGLDEVLGDGFAVLARGLDWLAGQDDSARAFFAQLGTRYVCVIPAGSQLPVPSDGSTVVGDVSGTLDRWLARGRAPAVLLRPDKVVFTAGREVDLLRWRHELESAGLRGGPAPDRVSDPDHAS